MTGLSCNHENKKKLNIKRKTNTHTFIAMSLFDLPDEVLLMVIESFTFEDRINTSVLCRKWYYLLHDSSLHKHWLEQLHYPRGAYPLLEMQQDYSAIYGRYVNYLKVLSIANREQEDDRIFNEFFRKSFRMVPMITSPHMVNCWKRKPQHLTVSCGYCDEQNSEYYCLVRFTVVCWNCFVGQNEEKGRLPGDMMELKNYQVGRTGDSYNELRQLSKCDEKLCYMFHQDGAKVKPWNHIIDSYRLLLPKTERVRFKKECMKLATRVPYLTGRQRVVRRGRYTWGGRVSVQNRSFSIEPLVSMELCAGTYTQETIVPVVSTDTCWPINYMPYVFYQNVEEPLLGKDLEKNWYNYRKIHPVTKGLLDGEGYTELCEYMRRSYLRGIVLAQEDIEYILVHIFGLTTDSIVRCLKAQSNRRRRRLQKLEKRYSETKTELSEGTRSFCDGLSQELLRINENIRHIEPSQEIQQLSNLREQLSSIQKQLTTKVSKTRKLEKITKEYEFQQQRWELVHRLQQEFDQHCPEQPPKKKRRVLSDNERCTAWTKKKTRCKNRRQADQDVCRLHIPN